MAYTGWVRRRRLEYAAATFQAPVWRVFIHPLLVMAEMARGEFPNGRVIVIDDERLN